MHRRTNFLAVSIVILTGAAEVLRVMIRDAILPRKSQRHHYRPADFPDSRSGCGVFKQQCAASSGKTKSQVCQDFPVFARPHEFYVAGGLFLHFWRQLLTLGTQSNKATKTPQSDDKRVAIDYSEEQLSLPSQIIQAKGEIAITDCVPTGHLVLLA